MRSSFKWLAAISIIIIGVILFLLSPYFNIVEINVTGYEYLTEKEILERAGLTDAVNIFTFNTAKAKSSIMENLYVEQVMFSKTYPGKLSISIRERHLSGYVEYMQGKYLYIDENGRVLEINSFSTQELPVVSGLKYNKVRLGEILEVEDATSFKTVVKYAKLIRKYQLTEQISRIEVSDSANTRLQLYHINVQLGDERDADEKIRTLKAIIEKMPNVESIKGFLDLREIKEQYSFKMMT